MTRKSNDVGRAFEYCVVNELLKELELKSIRVVVTERARKDNIRDAKYFSELPETLKTKFFESAKLFIEWAKRSGWLSKAIFVSIDRLPDRSGISGEVSDLILEISKPDHKEQRNISLKHHHDAIKHPRLPRLPGQCGITNADIKRTYGELHKRIWEEFVEMARKLSSNAVAFTELKRLDSTFIDENLYKPLNEMVIGFLKTHAKDRQKLRNFFQFLIPNHDFYTVKTEHHGIAIKHFLGIKPPDSFKITYPYQGKLNTFLTEFSNGWKMTFRLHTASSKFFKRGKINKSTKYDVVCLNLSEVIFVENVLPH